MKTVRKMNQGELAAYVDSYLQKKGINVVLSGGACVAIFSDYIYVSKDLDFVARYSLEYAKVEEAMLALGFNREGRYYYHADTSYYVEFMTGPLTVGEDQISDIQKLKLATGTLRIISPTACVKDRLAAFYHWGDRQTLEQAVLVARRQSVDFEDIREWSMREGKEVDFVEFLGLLEG